MDDTYKWMIPKPAATIPEFIKVYEAFADRPLGEVENPGEVILSMYPRSAWARRVFSRRGHKDMWQSTARCLLAASLWLGGEVEMSGLHIVSIRFGNAILEVTSLGCWVNKRSAHHRAAHQAFDQDFPATTIQSIRYKHPLLSEMYLEAVEINQNAVFACTVLATAMYEEIIDRNWIKEQLGDNSSKGPVRDLRSAERALQECSQILEEPGHSVLHRLYDAAVPNLMSSHEFHCRFGSPSRSRPDRNIRPATIERWHGVLKSAFAAST